MTCKLDRNRVQIFRITNSPKKCRVIMCKYEISIPLRGCKKLAFFLQKFTRGNGSINLQSLTSAKWRKYGTLAKVKRMRINLQHDYKINLENIDEVNPTLEFVNN